MAIPKYCIPLFLSTVLAVGCASNDKVSIPASVGEEILAERARQALLNEEYRAAANYLERLEAGYPYGKYSEKAKLDLAYAYYGDEEFDKAIDIVNLFLRVNPSSQYVPYALYIRGLSNFDRGKAFTERYFPRDLAKIDQTQVEQAARDFATIVKQHAQSEYAVDAQKRLAFLTERRAQYELEVADYYFRRGAMTAAVNRLTRMLEVFPRAPQRGEALALLAKAYQAQGLDDLYQQTRALIEGRS